jgi:hypothetical protein
MIVTELDTFVRKFHQLWSNGLTAHLDLDTHAGNAWVGLRVQLGQVPGPPHQQVQPFPQPVHKKGESPSRQRRRARRAAAKAASTANSEAVEADKVENETTEDVDDEKVADLEETFVAEKTEEVVDEFCLDDEFYAKIDELVDENSEAFKIQFSDKGWSQKSESQVLIEMERNLNTTFNFYRVNREDRTFKVIKTERCENSLEVYIKVNDVPNVLQAVRGLKTWITDVRKLAKRIMVPSSLPSS